jgi:hypothetical protein
MGSKALPNPLGDVRSQIFIDHSPDIVFSINLRVHFHGFLQKLDEKSEWQRMIRKYFNLFLFVPFDNNYPKFLSESTISILTFNDQ